MAVQINCESISKAKATDRIHHIPCHIGYDGNAKITEFFDCNLRKDEEALAGLQTASFRGRPLKGVKKEVPEGYTGVVLKDCHKVYNKEEDRDIQAIHTFTSYTHWNLDYPPSSVDKVATASQWLSIASAIHDPVSDISSDENTNKPDSAQKENS